MSGRGSVALTPMHTAHIFICFLRWSLPLTGGWDELDFIWTNQFVLIDTVQVFHFTECQTICLRRSGTKVVWVRVNFYFRTLVVTPKQYWNYDLSNILIYQDYYRSSSHSQGCQILSFGRYSLFGWSVWFWDLKYSLRILWHPPGVQTWTAIRWESVREWIFQKLSRDSQVGASRLKFRLGNNRVMQLPSPLTRSTSSTGL